ncbi:RecQ family ATP-dependent DNA helicase [Aestuariivirga litoralis]|uniref:RecQ family ATP-dependent DNA helicase n=1 Tax=Aestuariivirga litoralis TaxID=2650924 RepID=UPI0018C54041|nr:RecQ family ATP-dependent DNA helicase [Aestuariivirga litoralis]MBG1231432.1 RecQ family ATP-dependent DNA helicase [Aestuariivirga litoralis]
MAVDSEISTGGQDKHAILHARFGFNSFRPGQEKIVDWLAAGQHVLAVMPTGAGKSLCFQVPALMRGGVCIVVSPLVALMKDQVEGLKLDGISAETINSSQSREENVEIWKRVAAGEVAFLYLSPERLMDGRMLQALARLPVGLVAVDEAHCISQWGASFRPEYDALQGLRAALPDVPIGAFTATADAATQKDIAQKLFGGRANIQLSGFDRPNIRLHVARKDNKTRQLLDFVESRKGESGIVYALSRARTEALADELNAGGHRALAYHAGLPAEQRAEVQNLFMTEPGLIVCATIAFGMGIDKPDVRFVFHADLPSTLEAYYQEIGRAGRDGEAADAYMIFGMEDAAKRRRFINMESSDEARRKSEGIRLSKLVDFAEAKSCRRQALLSYFGQASETCGNCDNCLGLSSVASPRPTKKVARADAMREAVAGGLNEALLQRLKALRFKLAQAKRVPAYVIFHDRVLIEMAREKPLTEMDLGEISGVGPAKLEKFGRAFLAEIASYIEAGG